MVLGIVNGRRSTSKNHALFYANRANREGSGDSFVLSRRKNRSFIPRRKRRGILSEIW
jgi:hypothetical protein